jgi:hypothetical protein
LMRIAAIAAAISATSVLCLDVSRATALVAELETGGLFGGGDAGTSRDVAAKATGFEKPEDGATTIAADGLPAGTSWRPNE